MAEPEAKLLLAEVPLGPSPRSRAEDSSDPWLVGDARHCSGDVAGPSLPEAAARFDGDKRLLGLLGIVSIVLARDTLRRREPLPLPSIESWLEPNDRPDISRSWLVISCGCGERGGDPMVTTLEMPLLEPLLDDRESDDASTPGGVTRR